MLVSWIRFATTSSSSAVLSTMTLALEPDGKSHAHLSSGGFSLKEVPSASLSRGRKSTLDGTEAPSEKVKETDFARRSQPSDDPIESYRRMQAGSVRESGLYDNGPSVRSPGPSEPSEAEEL